MALVPTRIDFECARLPDGKAKLLENTPGRPVVVQSRRADLKGSERSGGELDQQASELRTEALTPERRQDRVPDGGYARWASMHADVAQGDETVIRPKCGPEAIFARDYRWCLAELACLNVEIGP